MNIDNNMLNYREPRLPYDQYMMVQAHYMRQRPGKPVDRPCITAPTKSEGGKFHAKG